MEVRRITITTERAGMGTSAGRIIPYCHAHLKTSKSSFRAVWCEPEQRVTHRRKVSFFWKVTQPPGDARPDRNPGAYEIGGLLKASEISPGKEGKFRKVVNHFTRAPPGLAKGVPLEPRFTTYQNEERMVSTMKSKTANRRRNKSVTFRMNESEYKAFTDRLTETGLTQQAFLMDTVRQAVILSEEGLRSMQEISRSFANLLRQVQGLANNVNQLAHWANQTGLVPEETELIKISGQIEKYRKECEVIWQLIRSLTTRQKHTAQCEPSSDMSSRIEKSEKDM